MHQSRGAVSNSLLNLASHSPRRHGCAIFKREMNVETSSNGIVNNQLQQMELANILREMLTFFYRFIIATKNYQFKKALVIFFLLKLDQFNRYNNDNLLLCA